jgi:hypothetical protein
MTVTVSVGGRRVMAAGGSGQRVALTTADGTPRTACSEPCGWMLVGLEGSCVQATGVFS